MAAAESAMALTAPASSAEPALLYIALDYGTKTMSLAYRVIANGRAGRIVPIEFSVGERQAPQLVAWTRDGEFLWGFVSYIIPSHKHG